MLKNACHVGIDTGGTFTDFTVWDGQSLTVHKTLSTPENPADAIISGLTALGLTGRSVAIAHGSTVATNALLERKGVRTAYISNLGLEDVLTIGRQTRDDIYCLSPEPKTPPVPESLCFGLDCRRDADGNSLTELKQSDIASLIETLKHHDVESVAVNLLFSFRDPGDEKALQAELRDHVHVSLSSETIAEIGEYERGIATWINASIGPLMQRYLTDLQQRCGESSLRVMQSNGLSIGVTEAADQAVRLLLSGPAGGLVGAQSMARQSGFDNILTLDVGGTSSDVALIRGEITVSRENRVAGFPVGIPSVDMHTIGSGGGSLVRIDDQGMMHVGPESAGASPGPACYGLGGTEPTVTDAHLILGRIPSQSDLGDGLRLNRQLAIRAFEPLAATMNMTVEQAAAGTLRLANEQMAAALRVISIERGFDAREFVLCCFGGAGGLHACDIAELMQIDRVMIPAQAGVLSAHGLLVSDHGHESSLSLMKHAMTISDDELHVQFKKLYSDLADSLADAENAEQSLERQAWLEMRYEGQSMLMAIPYSAGTGNIESAIDEFEQQYRSLYGHLLDFPVQLASIRLRLSRANPLNENELIHTTDRTRVADHAQDEGVIERPRMESGRVYGGPRVITESTGTTWVGEGWTATIDSAANLLLNRST